MSLTDRDANSPPKNPCIEIPLEMSIPHTTTPFEQIVDKLQSYVDIRPQNLDALAREIHEDAIAHGWWDEGDRNDGEMIALMHSELSEALEEIRNHKSALYFKDGKPEGYAVEVADCMIRILDWLWQKGIEPHMIMRIKMDYNKTRPYKHGGKKF